MTDTRFPSSPAFKEYFAEARKRLIEGTARALGGVASDAVKLSSDQDLDIWMTPTSDAANKAYEMGGSFEDAYKANVLSANYAKQQQAAVKASLLAEGATADQVGKILEQQGLTDEQIFAAHQQHAYNLGLANGKNDPAETATYHAKMAKAAEAKLAGMAKGGRSDARLPRE